VLESDILLSDFLLLCFLDKMISKRVRIPRSRSTIFVQWDVSDVPEPKLVWFKAYVHSVARVSEADKNVLAEGSLEYAETPSSERSTFSVKFRRNSFVEHTYSVSENDPTPCSWEVFNPDEDIYVPDETTIDHQNDPSSPAYFQGLVTNHARLIQNMSHQINSLQQSVRIPLSPSPLASVRSRALYAVLQNVQRLPGAAALLLIRDNQKKLNKFTRDGALQSVISVSVPCTFSDFTGLGIETEQAAKFYIRDKPVFSPSFQAFLFPYKSSDTYRIRFTTFASLCMFLGLHDPTIVSRLLFRKHTITRVLGTFAAPPVQDNFLSFSEQELPLDPASDLPFYFFPGSSWSSPLPDVSPSGSSTDAYCPERPILSLVLPTSDYNSESMDIRDSFTALYMSACSSDPPDGATSESGMNTFRATWKPPRPLNHIFRDIPVAHPTELGELCIEIPAGLFSDDTLVSELVGFLSKDTLLDISTNK